MVDEVDWSGGFGGGIFAGWLGGGLLVVSTRSGGSLFSKKRISEKLIGFIIN